MRGDSEGHRFSTSFLFSLVVCVERWERRFGSTRTVCIQHPSSLLPQPSLDSSSHEIRVVVEIAQHIGAYGFVLEHPLPKSEFEFHSSSIVHYLIMATGGRMEPEATQEQRDNL